MDDFYNFGIGINGFSAEAKKIVESNVSYINNYNMLKNIALSRFVADGLPKSMDMRYLELTLYNSGIACAINHPDYGWINTKALPNGQLNLYELNTAYTAESVVEVYGTYDIDSPDFCLATNNQLRTPTDLMIRYYCYQIFLIDMAINSNISLQKFSALFLCSDSNRLTYENILSKWQGNTPLIIGDKKSLAGIDEALRKIDFNVPYIADRLYEHKVKIVNEVLTYLGVNNNPFEKKERLVSDEVNSNNDYVANNMAVWTTPRQRFWEEFNEKSGYDVKFDINPMIKGAVETWQNTQLQSMS